MVNTLTVTISGSFKAGDGDIESFEGVTGIVPALDDDKLQQMVVKRYARIWIGQAMKLDKDGKATDEARFKRVQKVREVFLDNVEPNEGKKRLSYVGKSIMAMNFEELQDLAAAKDLAAVPLFKTGSLTHARRVAFSEYAVKVLQLYEPDAKNPKMNAYDFRVEGFNPAKFQEIIADGGIGRSLVHVASIEETLDREALAMNGKAKAVVTEGDKSARLTIEQLRQIATSKGITFSNAMSYEALHKRIYSQAAA